MADLIYTGRMRIHFNRHGAAPLVWCVATDQWELAVSDVLVYTPITTVYSPKATPDSEDGRPSAWLETHGRLEVIDGAALIGPVPE